MNHQRAVDKLKALPKRRGWSTAQAMAVIQHLDRYAFTRRTDYAEAVTAAITGQRWESVHGQPGYDTASTLTHWLGKGAAPYGNPATLFDAKTQQRGIGYSEKVAERASKATDYLDKREAGGVINGVVFHTRHGVFFQLGMDPESTRPQFGKGKRPIVGPDALPPRIDGNGGILPAIVLSSTMRWNGDGFDGLDEWAVQEVSRNLAGILKTVVGGVAMAKLQKHLDTQAKKAVAQAAEKMSKNRTARAIVAEKMVEDETARAIVAEKLLENEAARAMVAEKMAADPKALEAALKNALASGQLAEFLVSLAPEQKQQLRNLLG